MEQQKSYDILTDMLKTATEPNTSAIQEALKALGKQIAVKP